MSATARQRGELGHTEGTFLRRLTMVCIVVLVFSGLVVYWVGETTPTPTADRPPAVGQAHPPDDKARDGHQPTRAREEGADCDDRA